MAQTASGLQVAFLIFATTLVSVPISDALLAGLSATRAESDMVGRALPFLFGACIVLSFPALRSAAVRDLTRSIAAGRRLEVLVVTVAGSAIPFATVAALGLWFWQAEGMPGIDRRLATTGAATSARDFAWWLLCFGLAAPLMEELVFRGFLYRAFERQWGWVVSALATSTLFALYHPVFIAAFTSSLLFVCVLRRTGSLWAPILAHAAGNILLWPGLLGQFLLPLRGTVESPWRWTFHLACLVFVLIALPIYLWRSRSPEQDGARNTDALHAPLPQ